MSATLQEAPRPSHVPPELAVDLDFYSPDQSEADVHLAWKKLQSGPRLIWTPHNGGHWIATRGEEIKEIQLNHEVFSHESVTIPRSSTPSIPIELDPPQHTPYRTIFSALFNPETIKRVEAKARVLTIELIEGFKERGYCELQSEFSSHLPIQVFLMLVDLPLDDREQLMDWADKRVRSPIAAERDQAKANILGYLQNVVAERKTNPGDDFISRILHSQIDGRALTEAELGNMLIVIMTGGLDTVASMLGFTMRYLATHPEQRRRLIERPSIIPKAVDELIRRHGVANTARVIKQNVEFHGVQLKVGERILIPNSLYGMDEEQYEDAMRVDFDRPNANTHAAFGNGPHRCPGANTGRLEIRVVLEEWLKRIPDFEIDPDGEVVMSSGIVNTVYRLPLRWSTSS